MWGGMRDAYGVGEMMRAALAALTYPPDGSEDGLHALVADWGLDEFADFVAASQLIFEALAEECGPERVAAVVNELRRHSLDFD